MLVITGCSIVAIIFLTWISVKGGAYRHPWLLLIIGLIVAGFATFIKWVPIAMKGVPNRAWSANELEFSAALVDPTLVGLAGGLIAAAVVLKVQIMNATDIQAAKEKLARSIVAMQNADRRDDDLRRIAPSLTAEDYEQRLDYIKQIRMEAFLYNCEAKEAMEKLKVPGLQG